MFLLLSSCRGGTGVVVASLYYQSATKDHSHGKDKGDGAKNNGARTPAGPSRVSLSGVGTAVTSSSETRDEEAVAAQPLITVQQR